MRKYGNLAMQRAKILLSFQFKVVYFTLMSGSSYIQGVLTGFEIGNCRRTLDVYLVFAILFGEIISKLNYRLVTYKLKVMELNPGYLLKSSLL